MSEPILNTDFDAPTILVTLTGPDREGVSTRLFSQIANFDVEVVDIEQLVVRGRLVLAVLVTAPPQVEDFELSMQRVGAELGLVVGIEHGIGDNRPRRVDRVKITVIGAPLSPFAMGQITAKVAEAGGNIDRISRLARYPVTAIVLSVSGADPDALQITLAHTANECGVDIAVQESGIHQHAQRLIVMDVDSTLIQGEIIDKLALRAGSHAEVEAITEQAMAGEIDFAHSLRARVKTLAGLDAEVLDEIFDELVYTPGAKTMIRNLKRLGYRFALVSGGFTQFIARIARDLGIDFYTANELEIVDGKLTGNIVGPIIDRAGKAAALVDFANQARIGIKNTIAIGDGANDLDMLAASGLGIAFNAKPMVRENAQTAVNVPYLDAIMYMLGITREEVEAADALDEF